MVLIWPCIGHDKTLLNCSARQRRADLMERNHYRNDFHLSMTDSVPPVVAPCGTKHVEQAARGRGGLFLFSLLCVHRYVVIVMPRLRLM